MSVEQTMTVAETAPAYKTNSTSVDADIEKTQHNTAFTKKLQQGIQDIEEGRGIVRTMAELEALENA